MLKYISFRNVRFLKGIKCLVVMVTRVSSLKSCLSKICHLHEENNTLHEYLKINSFKEVSYTMKEIIYEEQ